ncbi:MAG TPA: hypothetical protein VNF04_09585 [Stellaceae bacterium]|nr:hypothetical protein [Stellaceae bacterium]
MDETRKLRELAAWLREFAERAGSPWIWEARLIQAKTLEDEADRLDKDGSEFDPARNSGDPVRTTERR